MLDTELTDDLVLPFQLESSSLRGRLVRLGPALDTILHQHAYPQPVGTLLGEAVVLAAALASALKYDGVFTLQIKSEGVVKMLVADVTSDGGVRGYAQFSQEQLTAAANAELIGKGYLAFTVDQKAQDRYQGIVELQSAKLDDAVRHYFRQSEQIPTGIIASVHCDEQNHWRGGCLMLQKMPREGGIEHISETTVDEDWQRAMVLMNTCTAAELTDPALPPTDLLYRLFHEEGVRIHDAQTLRHQCRCSEQRVKNMLRSLPRDEIETMAVNGIVDVTCEFCNRNYPFNQQQRDALYRETESVS